MDRWLEAEMRSYGRRLAGASAPQQGMRREFMRATRVYEDGFIDVDGGTDAVPMPLRRVPSTTSCAGVSEGDTVVVDIMGNVPVVTGVIARDNLSYVRTLWRGSGSYMSSGQRCDLSEAVSSQPHGVVLHWQGFADGEAKNYDHVYAFVPRSHVEGSPGAGVSTFMVNSSGSTIGTKYVYVHDDRVTGNDNNSREQLKMVSGITVSPRAWVLTEVLGV